jgi:hypothetical protein
MTSEIDKSSQNEVPGIPGDLGEVSREVLGGSWGGPRSLWGGLAEVRGPFWHHEVDEKMKRFADAFFEQPF